MSEWNYLDKFIGNLRYKKIMKYIPDNGVLCDMGCGQYSSFIEQMKEKQRKIYRY